MGHLPHLLHLRSFEASARLLSFTAAAKELNYTQSAVSGHVRSLEEYIGQPLFTRLPRSLTLTSLGEAYLPTVRQAMQQLDIATAAILAPLHNRSVTISCPISLATTWLVKQLTAFSAIYPKIDVTVHGRIWRDDDPHATDIHIDSVHQNDVPKGAVVLWPDQLVVVASPNFRVAEGKLQSPDHLRQVNLIHNVGRPDYWASVGRHFGLDKLNLVGGTQSNSLILSMELAEAGLGVAVVPIRVAQIYLDRGVLVAPFWDRIDSPWVTVLSEESKNATRDAGLLYAFLRSRKTG